jgi:phage shock protein B
MDDNTTAIIIVALVMMPAVMVIRYVFTGSRQRAGTRADAAQAEALMATAERMERRIESLEMLLDHELPGWRSRSRTP